MYVRSRLSSKCPPNIFFHLDQLTQPEAQVMPAMPHKGHLSYKWDANVLHRLTVKYIWHVICSFAISHTSWSEHVWFESYHQDAVLPPTWIGDTDELWNISIPVYMFKLIQGYTVCIIVCDRNDSSFKWIASCCEITKRIWSAGMLWWGTWRNVKSTSR